MTCGMLLMELPAITVDYNVNTIITMPQTLALPVKLKAIVQKLTETNTQVPL